MVPIVWRTGYNKNISKLRFYYDNVEVASLYATKIVIWNSGEVTIDGKDVVADFPLTIELATGHSIYDASLDKVSHTSNDFALKTVSEQKLQLTFSYIDSGEGCSLTVFHSGGVPTISGKVKGVKQIYSVKNVSMETTNKSKKVTGPLIGFWILMAAAGIFGAINKGPSFLLIPLFFLLMTIVPFFATKIPKVLQNDDAQGRL